MNLPKLLDLWVKGLELNWPSCYSAGPAASSQLADVSVRQREVLDRDGGAGGEERPAVCNSSSNASACSANACGDEAQVDSSWTMRRPAALAGSSGKPKAVALIGLRDLEETVATERGSAASSRSAARDRADRGH